MSKKKKSIMDGYFEQFKDEVADINPHVADMVKTDTSFTKNDQLDRRELLSVQSEKNVAKTQPERSDKGVQNVAKTQPERSLNVAEKNKTQPERSDKGVQNVAKTQPERSDKGVQNVAKKTIDSNIDPTLLVGTQREMFKYLFELTRKFASLRTPRLTIDSISSATGLRETQIHSATKQLRQKNCIVLSGRKDGRGGWVEYSVTQTAFDLWFRLENEHKRSQNVAETQPERSDKGVHKAIHSPPCSSSNININNNTTTTEDHFLSIPPKLEGQLPLHQIRALLKSGAIDQTTLEDSLWGFAHDLEKGLVKSKTGNTTGLFIGALKNGGYISQQYLSQKQQEILELKERLEEFKKLQAELENNQLIEEFEAFKAKYPEKAEQIKPAGQFIKSFESGSIGYRMWLDEYKRSSAQDLEAST